MWDQSECWPCPLASKALRKVMKELSYMQQVPMMKNCSPECIVQEGNSSLERNSMETNLLRYQERIVLCSIISRTFFCSPTLNSHLWDCSVITESHHQCFSLLYMGNCYGNMKKDQNSRNAYNLIQSLLVPACEQPFSYKIGCVFSRH